MLDQAIGYARLGCSVIPVHSVMNGRCSCGSPKCKAPGKHPRFKWTQQQSKSYSVKELVEIWEEYPDSNVGIVTGQVSKLVVLDIDGEPGMKSLEGIGLAFEDLPVSPTVRTGGGGNHIYYRYPETGDIQTKAGVLPKVDIRGKGGFVVAPPSVHMSGETYYWIEGRSIYDLEPVDADLSLLFENKPDEIEQPKSGTHWYERIIAGVNEGNRNESATRLAGRYIQKGLSPAEARFILQAWNNSNLPPLSEKEIDQVIKSVIKIDNENLGHNDLEQWVNDVLSMELSTVKRITGDDPRVILEFDAGTANISTAQLLSPKNFQQAIAEATKVVTRKLSGKTIPTHDQLAQAILNISVDVDAGIEATEIGEMQTFLKDFLGNQRAMPVLENDEKVPVGGVFRTEDWVWFNLADLVQRSSARWGIRSTMKTMAQKLKRVGAQTRVFNTVDDETRVVWGMQNSEEKL